MFGRFTELVFDCVGRTIRLWAATEVAAANNTVVNRNHEEEWLSGRGVWCIVLVIGATQRRSLRTLLRIMQGHRLDVTWVKFNRGPVLIELIEDFQDRRPDLLGNVLAADDGPQLWCN